MAAGSISDEIREFWDEDAGTYDNSPSHHPRQPQELAAWGGTLRRRPRWISRATYGPFFPIAASRATVRMKPPVKPACGWTRRMARRRLGERIRRSSPVT